MELDYPNPGKKYQHTLSLSYQTPDKSTLQTIISTHLLSNPKLVKKYTGPHHVHTPSHRYETQLNTALLHHGLKKFLSLILYLDQAKTNNVLTMNHCLFTPSSKIKSSQEMLSSFCRICFGRKDLFHHLSTLGLRVHHVQDPLEEYDYYVRNLSMDLKDGVRLAKMTQVLTQDCQILSKMRIPAESRLNRIYNVDQVLSVLRMVGVKNIEDVTPCHIVDAHQPRILQLLWGVISFYQIKGLEGQWIEEEVGCVKRWIEEKRGVGIGVREYSVRPNVGREEKNSLEEVKDWLLTWCQTVCSCYDVSVENFAESFSDGKVFCLLISFYHPTLLPFKDILPTVADLQSKLRPGTELDNNIIRMALRNEQYNLSLAMNRMQELGGIPRLFSSKDFLLPPDEKTTLLCVSFLFSRLTETSREIVAAREIQKWWRRVWGRRKREAAVFLLREWRQRRAVYFWNQRDKYAASVGVIEVFYRRYECKFKELARLSAMRRQRNNSAAQIQVSY